jgi:hypothetical protein
MQGGYSWWGKGEESKEILRKQFQAMSKEGWRGEIPETISEKMTSPPDPSARKVYSCSSTY